MSKESILYFFFLFQFSQISKHDIGKDTGSNNKKPANSLHRSIQKETSYIRIFKNLC